MATYSLVEQTNVEAAALVGLALNARGVPVLEEFWVIPEGTHQLYLALVTPLVDEIGVGESYRLIYEALDKETFVTRSFFRSQLILLGERRSKPLLDRIHAGATSVSRVGQHENAEVFPVPAASTIQKSGLLHILPLAASPGVEFPCRALFGALGSGGFIKPRDIENQVQLDALFHALDIRERERVQIVEALRLSKDSQTMIYNIGLDTLYNLKLV